jgi:hypothetical protein
MYDSFPTGASLPTSAPASESAALERWYRRLVACYPRSFRAETTEELVSVLLATARDDQRRPTVPEAADLLRGAVRMRMGMSRSPWTVRAAVRLMCLGAAAELGLLIIVLVTADNIRATVRAAFIQQGSAEVTHAMALANMHLFVDMLVFPCMIAGWLWMAWANGKGHDWARPAAIFAFMFEIVAVVFSLAQGDLTYAPASMTASLLVCAIGLAATVLLMLKPSWPYYERQPEPVSR